MVWDYDLPRDSWVPCNDPRHVKGIGHVCNFDSTKEGSATREREIEEYERGKGMSDSIKEKRLGELELGDFSVEAIEITKGQIIMAPHFDFCGEWRLGPKDAQLVARFILEMVGNDA